MKGSNMAISAMEIAKKLQISIPKDLAEIEIAFLKATRKGAFIAYKIIVNMHNQISNGAHALALAASNKLYDYRGDLAKQPEYFKDMYLQMAILSYNCCLDYVWECLYFYYNIGMVDFNKLTNKNIEEQYMMVKDPIPKIIMNKLEGEYPDLFQTINEYKASRRHINDLAIRVKHHGRLNIEHQQLTDTSINGRSGRKETDLQKLFETEYLNREQEIMNLVEFHNQTYRLEIKLRNRLDFSTTLELQQKRS
jgi:hypothetical protein